MVESREIHQVEYRWQPARDMSAVASSMSPESARLWVQRIGPWVRHPGVDAPTSSVRYEMFGDKAAALAWRQRDRQAVASDDGLDGRPLVSRVLLGPADLLTPEVAAAVCYMGLPETIGPRPGTVIVGAPLPSVAAAGLTGMVRDSAETLDRAAARAVGLERVVAAALGDRDTPLSVQLPERLIVRSPQGGLQALLLWGLQRTIWPLLGRGGGRRGWSFSTFELPLSDIDPETLPDVVFRLDQAVPQAAPMTTRKEIRVRPQDPVDPPDRTMHQHLARLLVVAYRDHGGDELSRLIRACAGDHPSDDRRIQAVYDALDASVPTVTVVSEQPGNAPVRTSATAAPDNDARTDSAVPPPPVAQTEADQERDAVPGELAQPVPLAVMHTAAPQPAGPAAPAERRQPEPPRLPPVNLPPPGLPRPPMVPQPAPSRPVTTSPRLPVTSPPAVGSTVSSGRSPQDAPRLFTGESQPRQAVEASPPAPATLSALLGLLAAGPASQEFKPAFGALCAKNFQSGPQDRVAARKLLSDHGWNIEVFRQYDQVGVEDILVMIFWHTVIPDLTERQVVIELADWAGKLAAPTLVIRALYAATEGAPGTRQLMEQALRPALAWRWLNENGIRPPAPVQAAATEPHTVRVAASGPRDPVAEAQGVMAQQVAAQPPGGAQILQSLLDRKVTMPVPLVLAICAAVIVLLVVTPR